MFLLGVGELLEEWTHKKSVGDLARSMSLNVGKVWLKKAGQEILVPSEKLFRAMRLWYIWEISFRSTARYPAARVW